MYWIFGRPSFDHASSSLGFARFIGSSRSVRMKKACERRQLETFFVLIKYNSLQLEVIIKEMNTQLLIFLYFSSSENV